MGFSGRVDEIPGWRGAVRAAGGEGGGGGVGGGGGGCGGGVGAGRREQVRLRAAGWFAEDVLVREVAARSRCSAGGSGGGVVVENRPWPRKGRAATGAG